MPVIPPSVVMRLSALAVLATLPLTASEAKASDIAASAVAHYAGGEGPEAVVLRRVVSALREGSLTVAEAESVLRTVRLAGELSGRWHRSPEPARPTAPSAVEGGVAAVEAVLAGEEPPPRQAAADPGMDRPRPAPVESDLGDAKPPFPVVAIEPGKEGRPDLVLIEGADLEVNQEWAVHRDGEPVVRIKILQESEDGLAFGVVLSATWAESVTERQVEAGELVWPAGADEEVESVPQAGEPIDEE